MAMVLPASAQQPPGVLPTPPVHVKIVDEKPVVLELSGAVDPTPHLQYQTQRNMFLNLRVDNRMIHLGYLQTAFHIDGQVVNPARFVAQNQPLPKGRGKPRQGFMTTYEHGPLTITQMLEVVPSRASAPGRKRRLDSALITYHVDNKDSQPHKVGMRIFMDVYIINNDGALFAAPNKPGKILDGIALKDKDVPDYLQILQNPSLQNPGFVAHVTYNFGRAFEMPNRVVLTRLGAFVNQWDLRAMQAMGDSAMGFYWDPKEIKPRGKRTMMYGFGQGIVPSPEGEGQVAVVLGGSFEPGKLFSISAYVQDPAPGQVLSLELPAGMERVEGKVRQPVPPVNDDGNTLVLWKASVRRTGQFAVRVHSSTGSAQTKIITISRPGEDAPKTSKK
jgi:hypothetical protein